jgi:cytidylate kinase
VCPMHRRISSGRDSTAYRSGRLFRRNSKKQNAHLETLAALCEVKASAVDVKTDLEQFEAVILAGNLKASPWT